MPVKFIKLKDAVRFAKDNSYIFAVYELNGKNYDLKTEFLSEDICSYDSEIVVKTIGCATDFNEFTTTDGKFCFRLHNNMNVPKIIPIFDGKYVDNSYGNLFNGVKNVRNISNRSFSNPYH
jgi:hypothetical protein